MFDFETSELHADTIYICLDCALILCDEPTIEEQYNKSSMPSIGIDDLFAGLAFVAWMAALTLLLS